MRIVEPPIADFCCVFSSVALVVESEMNGGLFFLLRTIHSMDDTIVFG